VMNSKHIRADLNFAWPTAEVAVMGSEGAVNILYRHEIAEAEDPDALKAQLTEQYRDAFANPYQAAALGYVDEVLRPQETRARLVEAFESLQNKRDKNPPKKHGNLPL
jgi:propionyl-CoA carboxylase beta chain